MKMPDRNMIFHPAFIILKFRLHFESQLQLFLVAWILVLI